MAKTDAYCVKKLAMKIFSSLILVLSLLQFAACGYSFQSTSNPLEKMGIKKVYVEGFRNRTFRPGVEHLFATEFIKEVARSKIFTLVNSKKDADAIFSGEITLASTSPSPTTVRIDSAVTAGVATTFSSAIYCTIRFRDKYGRTIFSTTVGASRSHPASLVLIDIEGENVKDIDNANNLTASLINESEQRLSYEVIAKRVMADAVQQLIDVF